MGSVRRAQLACTGQRASARAVLPGGQRLHVHQPLVSFQVPDCRTHRCLGECTTAGKRSRRQISRFHICSACVCVLPIRPGTSGAGHSTCALCMYVRRLLTCVLPTCPGTGSAGQVPHQVKLLGSWHVVEARWVHLCACYQPMRELAAACMPSLSPACRGPAMLL